MVRRSTHFGAAPISLTRFGSFMKAVDACQSEVWLECGNQRINARTPLGYFSMRTSCGPDITILAEGPDEEAAAEKLAAILEA